MNHAHFVRELRSLMRSPYALIHIETHEEARAVSLVHQLAHADNRPMWQWSPVSGFDVQAQRGLEDAFASIGAEERPGVFIFKDIAPYPVSYTHLTLPTICSV